jgi:signal transduction histidine kinase/CheY-like chemotaxis protein
MSSSQRILRVRRRYNQWVANQTLEDFALRFTALRARRWSVFRVANTALGAISFLALEAIGGAITLSFGFYNAVAAILAVSALIFLTGIPITYYAARDGVDVDLLSRGAGFGYIGSTITSLIYASFTFIFFAIEAAIMATALELFLDVPLGLGYLISAVVVIPLVTHGITFISRFQLWTQPVWLLLHLLPFVFIAVHADGAIDGWTAFAGAGGGEDPGFDLLMFGAASSVVFSLMAQIGEQVDFLRFLPKKTAERRKAWWAGLLLAGPGWIIPGCLKMLAGSFLTYLAFSAGTPAELASDPSHMYLHAFNQVFPSTELAILATGAFVVISQLKINVTNAYAGSIAWSNFFSRLTHSHPGRVVWLVFNVVIAYLLMELGIYKALEEILGLYAILAVAWVGALSSDLVINKQLGLSPRHIEFKRAHLFDVNPVGVGALLLATVVAVVAHAGLLGEAAQALSSFVALIVAIVAAPLIAWATDGRYYIARQPQYSDDGHDPRRCCICEHTFESDDMAHCPAYGGTICSLCCTLDARCHDGCKQEARFQDQILAFLRHLLPSPWIRHLNSQVGHYVGIMVLVALVISAVLVMIYLQSTFDPILPGDAVSELLAKVFVVFMIVYGVAAWLFVLASESRRVAQEESNRQTELLIREIGAHEQTDRQLQEAKEIAETANLAKTRYVAGLAHEFRTPLNAIYGYAQLLEKEHGPEHKPSNAVSTIRRSAEHLSELINGLLDIAQIEAGRLEIYRGEFSIGEFLDELVGMFKLQCEAKKIEFRYDRPARLPARVSADEKRLRQTLINLLTNAVKFTREGHVALRVRYRAQVAEFTVEDTGIGIPEEHRERIFLPFERINTPSAQAAKGTGLGLAISKLLAEVMGGDLTLRSEVGKGTSVTLKLFLPTASPAQPAAETERRIVGYRGPRRTVVVAEDEPAHRQLIDDVLSPLGFEMQIAADGPACLSLAARSTPDIFLLDISMPGMNGWELAQNLRSSGYGAVPIVMISADATELVGGDHGSSPHDSYLIKPIQLDSLLDELQHLLGLEWIWRSSGSDAGEQAPKAATTAAACSLPPGQRDELRRLCEIGHVRAVQSKLREMELRYPEATDAITELKQHIEVFDVDQFLRLLGAPDDR